MSNDNGIAKRVDRSAWRPRIVIDIKPLVVSNIGKIPIRKTAGDQ